MNAKHLMTGAIVGVLALAGCMSLEERLASNDAQIRREAEYELVAQARSSGKVDECVAAVGRVSDQQLLLAVAQSSPNGYEKEGIAAVGKISDEANLLTIAKMAKSDKVAAAALGKLTKQESILDVAKGAQLQTVRLGAYMRLSDQDHLLQVAMTSQDGKIKRAAIDKVTDQEKLLPMVFAPKATVASSPAQAKQMSPREAMKLKMTLMKQKTAKSSDAKNGGDSAETAKKDAAGAVNVDAELVDAFIAKCASDDVFFKLVKEHGAQLTDAQCATIKDKTKNQALLKMIDSVADLRIVAQAKASKDPKKYGELLDAIHDDDIRHDLCVDLVQKMDECRSYDEMKQKYGGDYARFVDGVRDGRQNVIFSKMVDQFRDSDFESIGIHQQLNGKNLEGYLTRVVFLLASPEERLSVLSKAVVTKGKNSHWCNQWVGEFVAKDVSNGRIKPIDVITRFKGRIYHEEIAIALVESVKTSSEAEAFLACEFVPECGLGWGIYSSDAKKILRETLERVVPLIGEKERAKGVDSARKHISERKQTEFSFGPFFVGMSVYEAMLLAADEKVQKGVSFDYEFERAKDWKTIMKDWRSNLKVTSISFTRKGALKYLDCEDSTILQQTIKQYVKKEKGKANSYDYASEIKHDVEVNTYRSINLFSPTGTKLNVDSEIWRVYTNSRMGVKIAHAEKSGALVISELAD